MGLNTTTYVLSKGYTKSTSDSLGAVKGAPATIKSITEIDGGHRVTFEWTGTSGTKQTSTLDVMNGVNGKDGKNGAKGTKGDPGQNGQDGTNGQDGIGISKIEKTKTEGLVDTYVITFSDDSTFEYTVTNGKDGKDSSGSSTGEENVIESIKVNGITQTVAEDKSVNITVPTVDVDKNYVDTELAKKANTNHTHTTVNGHTVESNVPVDAKFTDTVYDDSTIKEELTKKANSSDIPSLDGYVTDEELNAKGYLTEVPSEYITEEELTEKDYLTSHQDISGKVDKVKGKSLIADTEIERLKSVKNYDDTEIKAELTKKANSTDIPTKVSGLQNDSNYQTDTDVTTTLTSYATKTYVGEQISNADHLKREIVTEIPKPETADKNTIYMLKIESVTGNDKYREYLLIDGTVQCVGDTSVDLTDYAKTTDVDKKINNKADKTEIPTVPTNVSDFINDAGYLTEHQDISNLVIKEEGKGLSSNDYTSEEKTKLGGVGTSQGRNIIPYPLTNRTTNGIAYTVQSDGSVLANGIASAENNAYYNFAYKTLKLGDTSYTLSCEGLPKSVYVYVYDETISKAVANVSDTPVTKTFVGDSTHTYSLSINVGKGTSVSDLAIKPILEMGTIAHAYEPISESNVNLKDAIDKVSTSQGKNIIPYPYSQTTKTVYGVTFTDNKDGSIGISGTQDGSTSRPYMGVGIWWGTDKKVGNIKIDANTYFTISSNCGSDNAGIRYYVYDESGSKLADNIVYGTETKTLKFDVDTWVALCIETAANSETYDCICEPQLELGTIAHVYEPPIESNVNLKKEIYKVPTSQGRNLISYPYYNGTSYESNGVTYTVNEVDGTITVNGTATKESDFRLISPYDTSDRKTLELGQTYTLSDGMNQSNSIGYQAPVYFQFVRIDTTKNDFNYGISTNYGNMTWTASDANLLQYGIRIVVRSGVTVDNVVLKPMLEIGAIAHSYEPTTESNVSLKKSIETKATINDTSTTSTTETWSAKKINEKTAQNFNNRIILSVSRGANAYTDTAHLNSSDGAYLYWSSSAGQEKYSVGVILYVYNGWMIIPIKETDGGTGINFSVESDVLTMSKDSTTFPCAGGVIALGASI